MSTTHEDYGRELERRGPSDRNFGFVFTAAFLIFGLLPLRHGHPVRLWSLGASAAILLITLLAPWLLHAPNRVWTMCGILLGKVVNPIVTGLLFYLVFTPIAAVLRWMGKDLLRLSKDSGLKSYWIPRTGEVSDMSNQF